MSKPESSSTPTISTPPMPNVQQLAPLYPQHQPSPRTDLVKRWLAQRVHPSYLIQKIKLIADSELHPSGNVNTHSNDNKNNNEIDTHCLFPNSNPTSENNEINDNDNDAEEKRVHTYWDSFQDDIISLLSSPSILLPKLFQENPQTTNCVNSRIPTTFENVPISPLLYTFTLPFDYIKSVMKLLVQYLEAQKISLAESVSEFYAELMVMNMGLANFSPTTSSFGGPSNSINYNALSFNSSYQSQGNMNKLGFNQSCINNYDHENENENEEEQDVDVDINNSYEVKTNSKDIGTTSPDSPENEPLNTNTTHDTSILSSSSLSLIETNENENENEEIKNGANLSEDEHFQIKHSHENENISLPLDSENPSESQTTVTALPTFFSKPEDTTPQTDLIAYPITPITKNINYSNKNSTTKSVDDIISNIPQYIFIKETPNVFSANGSTGHRTWEAALALSEYILTSPNTLQTFPQTSISNKRNEKSNVILSESTTPLPQFHTILELGAGTGLAGLVAASHLRSKSLVLTDGDDVVVEGLTQNIARNLVSLPKRTSSNSRNSTYMTTPAFSLEPAPAIAMKMYWGDDKDLQNVISYINSQILDNNTSETRVDVTPESLVSLGSQEKKISPKVSQTSTMLVLAADVTYDASAAPSLVYTISQLFKQSNYNQNNNKNDNKNNHHFDDSTSSVSSISVLLAATIRSDETFSAFRNECQKYELQLNILKTYSSPITSDYFFFLQDTSKIEIYSISPKK